MNALSVFIFMTYFWKVLLDVWKKPEILRWSVHSPPQDILTRIGLRGIPVVKLINSPSCGSPFTCCQSNAITIDIPFKIFDIVSAKYIYFQLNCQSCNSISWLLCRPLYLSTCFLPSKGIANKSGKKKYDFWNNVVAKAHQIWFSQSLLWLGWEGIKG